jgi:hypothetical protein
LVSDTPSRDSSPLLALIKETLVTITADVDKQRAIDSVSIRPPRIPAASHDTNPPPNAGHIADVDFTS